MPNLRRGAIDVPGPDPLRPGENTRVVPGPFDPEAGYPTRVAEPSTERIVDHFVNLPADKRAALEQIPGLLASLTAVPDWSDQQTREYHVENRLTAPFRAELDPLIADWERARQAARRDFTEFCPRLISADGFDTNKTGLARIAQTYPSTITRWFAGTGWPNRKAQNAMMAKAATLDKPRFVLDLAPILLALRRTDTPPPDARRRPYQSELQDRFLEVLADERPQLNDESRAAVARDPQHPFYDRTLHVAKVRLRCDRALAKARADLDRARTATLAIDPARRGPLLARASRNHAAIIARREKDHDRARQWALAMTTLPADDTPRARVARDMAAAFFFDPLADDFDDRIEHLVAQVTARARRGDYGAEICPPEHRAYARVAQGAT